MKQFLVLVVALVAMAANAGERSSGGRPWIAHSVTFIFSEMYPQYYTVGDDPQYGTDIQLIRDVVSKELTTGKIREFRTDTLEFENFGKFPHAKMKTFAACLTVRDSGELDRIRDSVSNHLQHKLNVIAWDDCDWPTIQKIYKWTDLPSAVLRQPYP